MKLPNVWVVEAGVDNPDGMVAQFDLRVEPDGWTLTEVEQSIVERKWSWDTIGGLEVVRGVGKTPDGRPATALDVVVNGWPVRLLVPTEDMTVHVITMIGAFAPLGHPLRGSPRVKGTTTWQRWSAAARGYSRPRLPARPGFLDGVGVPGLRSVVVVALVLVATVVGASIAGVATSASPTSTSRGPTGPAGTGSGADGSGSSTGGVPGPAPSSSSASPALAASGGGHGRGPTALIVVRPQSGGPSSQAPPSTTKPTTAGKGTPTTAGGSPISVGGSPTTGGTPTTTRATTPTTTTAPTTTTTRVRRPHPTTTTTAATTTTTQATTTTTQATTTTTSATTTTSILGILGF